MKHFNSLCERKFLLFHEIQNSNKAVSKISEKQNILFYYKILDELL